MSSQHNDPELQVVAAVLIAAIGLALGLALGVGIHLARSGVPSAPAPVVGVPAMQADAPTPVAVADDASVVVDNGVVKFYFASGQADLAPGALDALGEAIAAAKEGQRLVLSGFHDATGNPVMNAELAKQRALSVRAVLLEAGVAESRLELKKPEAMSDNAVSNAEARRVEVSIAD